MESPKPQLRQCLDAEDQILELRIPVTNYVFEGLGVVFARDARVPAHHPANVLSPEYAPGLGKEFQNCDWCGGK